MNILSSTNAALQFKSTSFDLERILCNNSTEHDCYTQLVRFSLNFSSENISSCLNMTTKARAMFTLMINNNFAHPIIEAYVFCFKIAVICTQ